MLDKRTIQVIEEILARGDRAEVVPGPKGTVKVLEVRRSVVRDSGKRDA